MTLPMAVFFKKIMSNIYTKIDIHRNITNMTFRQSQMINTLYNTIFPFHPSGRKAPLPPS
jgi:hypothetical protein